MAWLLRFLVILGLGFGVGFVASLVHHEPWNRPIHWVDLGLLFGLFPLAMLSIAIFERTYVRTTLDAVALTGTYLLGYEWVYYLDHGVFWDDMLMVVPIAGGYLMVALALVWWLKRIDARPAKPRNEISGDTSRRFPDPIETGNPYQSPRYSDELDAE